MNVSLPSMLSLRDIQQDRGLNLGEDTLLHADGTKIGVGDRLVCDGDLGTIRYIGEVPPTKGIWLGVEWDDPERGKHNGTHEGHTYFTTSGPKAGSFIRAKKADFGMSFMAAVQDRYGEIEDENAGVETDQLFVLSAQKVQKVVEMVGARKVNLLQSKLDKLKEVIVRDMQMFGTSPSQDLSALVPSITILDISKNLVPSWSRVAEITKQLPKLHSLNVSENILPVPNNREELKSSFSHITDLFLNRMGYTWEQILQCCEMFPKLQQLHCCFNSIQTLSSVEGRLDRVELVNLESNKISRWSQLLHLAHLPVLKTLIVSDNSVSNIWFDGEGKTDMFPSLQSLTANYNKVSEWSSINELNKLAGLTELRLKSNPIMETANTETVRQWMIAKLKHLTSCNRTEIIAGERQGAEIDYLKHFGPEWVKSGGNQEASKNQPSQEFCTNHPRYQDLVEAWGPPEDSEMKKQSTSLKSSLIPLKIECVSLPEKGMLQKKLPGSMTVQKLKALIHRLYKLDSEIELSYKSQKMAGTEIPLESDQRDLAYYSIEPDDVIQVKLV